MNPGPVGNGLTITPGDLSFILKQIKIAERHSRAYLGTDPSIPANPNVTGDPNYCQSMVGSGADQIPDILTSYGLRTVDGSCNNLVAGRDKFAASDVPFPRLTTPVFRDAEAAPAPFPTQLSSSYKQKLAGNTVYDTQPRVISNLIVDQTASNPAAVAAATHPVRTQNAPASATPCTTDPSNPGVSPVVAGVPAGCTASWDTLFIPNVTTDVGLSPPYNSLFTFFGQFFDHGVDQTVKSGGTVIVPLRADDPLRTVGPDGIAGTGDEVPANQAFMVLTRAQNQPGPDHILGTADDIQNTNNTDTPWVDQSQTYTSHASHQVFLREYVNNSAGHPVSTGHLLGGLPGLTDADGAATDGSISTWAATKAQAKNLLGLLLQDKDVTNIPMIAADPYGKFTPGPNGLPQYVTTTGLVEGNLATPVAVPANVLHFDTPFLTDIAHNADPGTGPCTVQAPDPVTLTPGLPAGCLNPDADATASADFAHQPFGTYDDEMLNDHFTCGDGRCNENIALSTIHQIFHSEHDRLVEYIKGVLTSDTSPAGVAALPEWKSALGDPNGNWNGERLFQAARFVTEMEYQHLVFEEFARKVQPAVRPFHVYSPDINPAVEAEFAHAVYRFGHSMLDDTVARTNMNGSDNSLPLLKAFLNPPEYFNSNIGGATGDLTPAQAAGSIVMGSSDQVGNELDEFVTKTLRSNLLGLPLDLPVLNLTRARDAGIPPLNDVRRQIFAQTNDGQLAPYTSWNDFGQHLKHPESLINFVAAYGTHPTTRDSGPDGTLGNADDVTTVAAKRAAATALVNADIAGTSADASDFMNSTGAYASVGGVTTTGLDDVDLWVGGLAEVTNLFGGLLGSTFNYVFQSQLEKLQDGDRLYYLNRTPGMNFRSQLEGNSFSELIQRNTDGTNSLKADAFATADCKFQLANITFPFNNVPVPISASNTPPLAAITGSGSVNDDPSTPNCDENQLLLRKPDGTIQYRAINGVNPSGINSQSVYQGTPGNDRIWGGNDNDTFWGGPGNDVIEGNGGDDVALGGDGNDIITDLSGADVLKGGPGNDAIDGGIGDDILLGGDGQDFINGGANDNETFAGPGNDYVIAGQGADAVFGDGGDDWIEGGTGQDLLQGDHGAPFFDDPAETAPGNDIFIGQPGENDYDAEGGDDLMAQNAAIDRNAGAGGFDWAFHQYDTVAAVDDMMINNNLGGLPIQVIVNRDRWQETEADSGGPFNDTILGTDGVLATPRLIGGGGFQGCDALDQAGVDRISGLAALLPPSTAWLGTAAETAALSTHGVCPLTGPVWGEGDILLGGGGSDTITGRAGNEIIDGDKELHVAISVRDAAGAELGTTDLMEHQALTGSFGTGTAGMTLQQAVFAGLVNPGNLVNVRSIINTVTTGPDCGAATPLNCDTAAYSDVQANYDCIVAGVTTSPCGLTVAPGVTTTVVHARGTGIDGTDTLTNIEQLRFSDSVVPGAPLIGAAVAGTGPAGGTATVNFTPGTGTTTTFNVQVFTGTTAGAIQTAGAGATSLVFTGLTPGVPVSFKVQGVNAIGPGPFSASSNVVTPVAATFVPGAPTIGTASAGVASATVNWTAPASNGGTAITSYNVQPFIAGVASGAPRPAGTGTSFVVTGLTNGTAYTFTVTATNAVGTGLPSGASNAVTPAAALTVAGAPTAVTATAASGTSATVNWAAPASNGGSAISGYSVQVLQGATQVGALRLTVGPVTSLLVTGLPGGGTFTFRVSAINGIGTGLASANSPAITLPVTPGAPGAVAAARGTVTQTVRVTWIAPAVTGGAAITGYSVRVVNAANIQVGALRPALAGATSLVVTGLTNGQSFRFQVQANNIAGPGAFSALTAAVIPGLPFAPTIGTAVPGVAGGAVTASARWTAGGNGGVAITGFRVTAHRVNGAGVANGQTVVATVANPAAIALQVTMTGFPANSLWRFSVQAVNAVGPGDVSGLSNIVAAR